MIKIVAEGAIQSCLVLLNTYLYDNNLIAAFSNPSKTVCVTAYTVVLYALTRPTDDRS